MLVEPEHRALPWTRGGPHRVGEDLSADRIEVMSEHVQPGQVQMDPVRDLEAVCLAQILDETDDLAGQAPQPKILVEREVEGHHFAPVARHREAGPALHPQLNVPLGQLHDPVGKGDLDSATSLEGGRHLGRIERVNARGSACTEDPRRGPSTL